MRDIQHILLQLTINEQWISHGICEGGINLLLLGGPHNCRLFASLFGRLSLLGESVPSISVTNEAVSIKTDEFLSEFFV